VVKKTISIGGACGFWGESDMALSQFLEKAKLDYVVFDYLAEVTLSIMARARHKDPSKGYALDFVSRVLKPNLREIANQNVKIISNAGGMNPRECGRAIETLIDEAGLALKVAVVTGDDLLARAEEFAAKGALDMFSLAPFPDPSSVASINAYLGAGPIAKALDLGADIVITGRCVDSAVTLGACMHAFGWSWDSWDLLATGSLVGHLIECGPQATGGNFTDWEDVVESLGDVGYPIAEISSDGTVTITKPEDTGGLVSVGTVGEQMLYEIGDPSTYLLPDVICDFRGVSFKQVGEDRVEVVGAKGRPAPKTLKVSVTYNDGWRAGSTFFFVGQDAAKKARAYADLAFERARSKLRAANLPGYTETEIELIGDGSSFGSNHPVYEPVDVAVKIAAKHPDSNAAGLLVKEAIGLALSAPPGLSNFSGTPSRPSPVVRLFSFLEPKQTITSEVEMNEQTMSVPQHLNFETTMAVSPTDEPETSLVDTETEFPLIALAWARSGDKGDKANIGILPRDSIFAEWIWRALSKEKIHQMFEHYLEGEIERYFMPGTGAMNIVLDRVLGGGGVASLRNDPQGKTYAQLLLQTPIALPATVAGFVGAGASVA